MKFRLIRRGALLVATGGLLLMGFRSEGQAPTITSQPQGQVVSYSSDVSFSVAVTGEEPLAYQWLKNGHPLVNFDNVAGSQASVLHLVGVAENDVAGYSVLVTNQTGSITSSVAALGILPSIKFTEDFESGMTDWGPLFDSIPMTLDTNENHSPSGSFSLLATNGAQRMYHNLEVKYACRVVFTFWMYDDGSALPGCAQLRGYTGAGYGKYATPSALVQELVIGKYNTPFGTNGVCGAMLSETLNTDKYQGRVIRGLNQGWFNLDAPGAPGRSVGWHKFQIDRAAAGSPGGLVSFYVDDVLAKTVTNAFGGVVNSILLGPFGTSATNNASGSVWFDDLTVQAYPGLFDWQTLDSTGRDLFPDWMKLREVGTNARVIAGTPATVFTVAGSVTNDGLGDWIVSGQGIDAVGLRGYLEYTFDAPSSDPYRIEVDGREKDFQPPINDPAIIVSVDGEVSGSFVLPHSSSTDGTGHCFTPYLRAGSHVVRLFWDNTSLYTKLHIDALRLQSVGGGAMATNGMKMWVANRLEAQCGVEYAPAFSFVSPVCVEGRGQYLSMMNLTVSSGSGVSSVSVSPGAGNRWWANVPLSPDQPTVMTASFQNGGRKETNEMEWRVTNLLETNNAVIRQGDSLLFAAVTDGATNGEMTIAITGDGSVTTNVDTPVPYQFNQPGPFIVTGTYLPTGAAGSITVNVVAASFGGTTPARAFKTRFWSCTNLPPGVVIDADPRLRVIGISDNERARIMPALPPKSANERDFWLRISSAETQYVLARLGENGPVLAEAAIQGFHWNIAPDTYLRIIDHNSDGSQLIETAFVMSPLMPAVTVQTQPIVSGVTFDDGTITKTLTADDFDATGVCRLWFIRAAGVTASTCHTTHLYDGTTLIGFQ